jgi:hypothetical protein
LRQQEQKGTEGCHRPIALSTTILLDLLPVSFECSVLAEEAWEVLALGTGLFSSFSVDTVGELVGASHYIDVLVSKARLDQLGLIKTMMLSIVEVKL